jgi:hypothetical protein
MQICAWNINNRVGQLPFKPQAALAAAEIDADVIVLNEFYPPAAQLDDFLGVLRDAGWSSHVMSPDTGVKANRTLIASRRLMVGLDIAMPTFDAQFPANIAAAFFPVSGLKLIGLRVPAYNARTAPLMKQAWSWIEATARSLADDAAVIVGDLNASMTVTGACTRPQLARILSSGWQRAEPIDGPSYLGLNGTQSEIDHLLATARCHVEHAKFVTQAGEHQLAGTKDALSDHAALVCTVRVRS